MALLQTVSILASQLQHTTLLFGKESRMRITINNLASEAHEEDLRTLFELFGRVGSIEIKKDQGRAFVEMSSKSAGKEAITELNGQNLLGFEIEVFEAQKAGGKKSFRRKGKRR